MSLMLYLILSIFGTGSSTGSDSWFVVVSSGVVTVAAFSKVISSWSHAKSIYSRATGSRINLRNIWSALGITRNGGQSAPEIFFRNSLVFCKSRVSFRFSKRLNSLMFCSFTSLLMMLMSWLVLTPVASLRFMICFFSSVI